MAIKQAQTGATFTDVEVREYNERGFVVVKRLFDPEQTVPMADAVEGILAELREDARKGDKTALRTMENGVYVGLTLRRRYLRDVFRNPNIVGRLNAIFGPKVGFLSDKIVFKSEDVSFPTPWHQDYAYWGGSHKMSVWMSLDVADTGNGCMQFLPGSHLKDIEHDHLENPERGGFRHQILGLERLGYGEKDIVTVEAQPGDAVFFHDDLLHRSLPNTSGARRRAFIITYRSLSEPDKDYPNLEAAEPIT